MTNYSHAICPLHAITKTVSQSNNLLSYIFESRGFRYIALFTERGSAIRNELNPEARWLHYDSVHGVFHQPSL